MATFPALNNNNSLDVLLQQIYDNIVRVLNTRTSVKLEDFLAISSKSIFFYGIPDMAHLVKSNEKDMQLILACVRKALDNQEPRFKLKYLRVISQQNKQEKIDIELIGLITEKHSKLHEMKCKVAIGTS